MRKSLTRISLAILLAIASIGAPQVLAADVTGIGFLDQNALANVPSFKDANKKFVAFRDQLQREFMSREKNIHNQQDQAKLTNEFQGRLAQRQA